MSKTTYKYSSNTAICILATTLDSLGLFEVRKARIDAHFIGPLVSKSIFIRFKPKGVSKQFNSELKINRHCVEVQYLSLN